MSENGIGGAGPKRGCLNISGSHSIVMFGGGEDVILGSGSVTMDMDMARIAKARETKAKNPLNPKHQSAIVAGVSSFIVHPHIF